MAHIHTEAGQHDATVSCFIIRTESDKPRVLLHMHRKLKKLLPVGGHVELGENPWQTVAHELAEESGYQLNQLQILQPPLRLHTLSDVVLHPYPVVSDTHDFSPTHFHIDLSYAFVTTEDPAGQPDDGESLDIRWLSREELQALSEAEIFANTKEIYMFILDHLLDAWEAVPTSAFHTTYPAELMGGALG